ncbi:glycoside hydrolase family 99-like domain-containing protein [Burkholderia ubonensis]|uniref:glycoside hydrolase family 99-like domain-containing protein n=1 Tax=Burkholderia ubonensis TaxID=101571 RepID=UPI00075A27E0|nr:glycoside hydrolase family 99-like domain-containing protein [Burkholderia ubonensis]KVU62731.1 glycosyl transferase [Burkholderia ubonensis]
MRVIIGLVEHIGDIVACEPVARYVKMKYPECEVTWVVDKAYRELVDTNPYVDKTIAVECLTDWIKISRHDNYDKVIDLHVNYRVCSHCRIPLIKEHGNPFINAFEWLDHGALLEAFSVGAGLPKLSAAPRLYLGESHARAVDSLGLPIEYCVIHRESNNVEKDWTGEKWESLANWIAQNLKLPIVEIGVSKDGVVSPLAGRAMDLVSKTSILETAEVIRRARFFIGVDSGPAHLANAVGTPGVILLGRMGAFRQYTPYTGLYGSDAPEVQLARNLTGPARELPVQEVIDATRYVAEILNGRRDGAARARPQSIAVVQGKAAEDPSEPIAISREDRALVRESALYDEAWYVLHYPEVESSGMDPVDHFLSVGGRLGYRPGPDFDGDGYLNRNSDVASSGMNPLLHYVKFGANEGREVRQPGRIGSPEPKQPKPGDHQSMAGLMGKTAALPLELKDLVPVSEVPRTFAFYLPQFHPIAENNWAHGMGFTEWNNVIKSKPLFPGHYQPKVPGELGYYDLRSFDVMREQVDLALAHGISGFCFYYYYFHGKKLLYKPIENYIRSDLKMPFFFLWANENWSKRWDGGDQEVIIEQHHSPEDDVAFIRELFPLFEDERYTKVNGKPVLMIYKAHLFPDVLSTTEIWREEMAKRGFPGIYLVMVDDWSSDPVQPRQLGFDASYEIPSNVTPSDVLYEDAESLGLQDDFTGRIVDYDKFAKFHMSRSFPEYRRFRTVMLPWDNTARYGSRAIVHVNTQTDAYKTWLSQAMLDTYTRYPAEERFVFLHSWNEWCEGTYLEPDGKSGRRYLEQTRDAIEEVRNAVMVGLNAKEAHAVALLRRIQREKDEGAFRILQATRVQLASFGRARDTLSQTLHETQLELARTQTALDEALEMLRVRRGNGQPTSELGRGLTRRLKSIVRG